MRRGEARRREGSEAGRDQEEVGGVRRRGEARRREGSEAGRVRRR